MILPQLFMTFICRRELFGVPGGSLLDKKRKTLEYPLSSSGKGLEIFPAVLLAIMKKMLRIRRERMGISL